MLSLIALAYVAIKWMSIVNWIRRFFVNCLPNYISFLTEGVMKNWKRLHKFGLQLWRDHLSYGVILIFQYAVGVAALTAVALWLLAYLPNPHQSNIIGSPFTLAQVTAIFGGFGVAAGFSKYGDRGLRLQLRRAGALNILSALGFSLLGMLLPISAAEGLTGSFETFLLFMSGVALILAMMGFASGTVIWVSQLHKLLDVQGWLVGDPITKDEKHDDGKCK